MDGTRQELQAGSPVVVLTADPGGPGHGPVAVRRRLARLLESGPPELVVDVNGLETLSSATVAVLLRARRLCRARGGDLVLHHPRRHVLAVLRRSGLEGLFEVRPDPRAGTRAAAHHPAPDVRPQAS